MTCLHRRDNAPDGMACTREDPHDADALGGHVYRSSSGSDVDDRHTEGGHG